MCFKDDTISRQAAIRWVKTECNPYGKPTLEFESGKRVIEYLKQMPSTQPEHKGTRIFQEIIVEYPSIYVYPDYRGKPYFSIKYTENGQEFIGYGTYKPEVLSEYLKEYFIPSAQPEQRWIPCNERLPAYGEGVLISIGGHCNVGYIVSVNEEEQYNWYFSGWYHSPNDVDAWMPLPEPWKEGETE